MAKEHVSFSWFDPMPSINDTARKAITEICAKVTTEAKSLATGFKEPTGRLLNSIMWQVEETEGAFDGSPAQSQDKLSEPVKELTAYVGTNVFYAVYVEAGTRKMAAHPYLRPAIAIHAEGEHVAEVMRKWEKVRSQGRIMPDTAREVF